MATGKKVVKRNASGVANATGGGYQRKPKKKPVRVLIVEDQDITAKLFESYLVSSGRYILAGSIQNADLAPVFCEKSGVDLVLMDVYTELGTSGIDAAALIKESHPEIKIIIITSLPEVSYLTRAKEAGVESFWYKEADGDALLSVCDRTMAGESVYPGETPVLTLGLAKSSEFTSREWEVLRELVRGSSNNEIAETLFLSVATVKDHVSSLMGKTGFKTRTELAVKARESGLVIPE